MNVSSISLRRTLNLTMKDTLRRIKELSGKDSQALAEEYREWIDAAGGLDKHPHVLFINQLSFDSKNNLNSGPH